MESGQPQMEIGLPHMPLDEETAWNWPVDVQTPVDITQYYVCKHRKSGLSYWVGAARRIGQTAHDWEQRRKAPISYLLKVGSDAIHERLYYVLARALNLPQQHVFWAVTPPHRDLVAVAIQFERDAFFPKRIDVTNKTVLYRRKRYAIINAEDFWRHEVLHYYCGTGDIHQAMVKGKVLFGIDAADCRFYTPFLEDRWQRFLEHHQKHNPAGLPVLREMMHRIVEHPEVPDLVEHELANAPGPVLEHLARLDHGQYGENLRAMHASLVQALS
ncbi:hypothetical protein KSC_057460 [Ktedonobacter sp. SOSP1-52]|uniref:hypothetical protein n=1 Tax=Ktedonobacter sp. SOSP1-52 TaxID=2778366 RepID=UPI00191652CB|nr:hypothetical protein [Ktedonobacter sp. SOSP1-52]GHO66854.1 hypothetical protein KSC_057460 [Ktedonobacter sp. SOSP1-52]